jgi:hypothetical protein
VCELGYDVEHGNFGTSRLLLQEFIGFVCCSEKVSVNDLAWVQFVFLVGHVNKPF